MKKLHFTQWKIIEILLQVGSKKDGVNEILQISLVALIRAERILHNNQNSNVSNGFRSINCR
jgi:hypothetical protein